MGYVSWRIQRSIHEILWSLVYGKKYRVMRIIAQRKLCLRHNPESVELGRFCTDQEFVGQRHCSISYNSSFAALIESCPYYVTRWSLGTVVHRNWALSGSVALVLCMAVFAGFYSFRCDGVSYILVYGRSTPRLWMWWLLQLFTTHQFGLIKEFGLFTEVSGYKIARASIVLEKKNVRVLMIKWIKVWEVWNSLWWRV